MNKESTIDEIVNRLGSKKDQFLSDVQYAIDRKISNSSVSDCLTIVIRHSDGTTTTWYPKEAADGYLPRFVAFVRKKKYNGAIVDSYLTDKVVKVVTDKFESFYSSNSEIIAKPVLALLLKDKTIARKLVDSIIDSTNGAIPSALKDKLRVILLERLNDTMLGGVIHSASDTVTTLTGKVVASAAALPVSKALAMLLVKNFAIVMKGTVAKVLASTAVKTMLATTVKKLVAVKVLGATIAIVASKLGITSSGAVFGWIVAPLILAFLTYEVYTLPKKMGARISEEVRSELSGQFNALNKNVVSSIVSTILYSGLSVFSDKIASDPDLKTLLKRLVSENK